MGPHTEAIGRFLLFGPERQPMARRAKPGSDPVAATPAGPATDVAPPDTFEVTFPPDLIGEPEAEPTPAPVLTPPAPVPAPVIVPTIPEPVRVIATPKPGSALAILEESRRIYEEELAKTRATTPAGKPAGDFEYQHDGENYDVLPTITEGFTKGAGKLGKQLTAHFAKELSAALADVRHENAVARINLSESLWRQLKPDYDTKLEQSGVLGRIALDGAGRPRHPEKYDPRLVNILYVHPDPAQYAYTLAGELLEQGQAAQAAAGGGNGKVLTEEDITRAREEGRRDAEATRIKDLERAANRPVGIAGIPAASGVRRTISLSDIGGMSSAQQDWIQEHHPEQWKTYKRSLFGLPPQ